MWMNKKGVGVDDFIPLFIMILFFFFFMGFIFITGNNRAHTIQASTNEIKEKMVSQDILMNYLEIPDDGGTKFDILLKAASDGRITMSKEYRDYFSRIYDQSAGNNWRSWLLTVRHSKGGEYTINGNISTNKGGGAPRNLASTVAPLDDENIVTVRISKVGFGPVLNPQPLEMP